MASPAIVLKMPLCRIARRLFCITEVVFSRDALSDSGGATDQSIAHQHIRNVERVVFRVVAWRQ